MSKLLSRIGHFIFLGSLFIANPSLLIASDDWVLEKRFKEQLSQAGKGDTQAMYEIGRMYERGRGVDEDASEAVRWYIKSASGGSDSAHARLGMIYFTGQGAAQDYPKARSHLVTAAKNNDPAAQYYLAMMFEQGKAVKQNTVRALTLYKKSAAGGYYQAQNGITRLKKTSKVKSVRLPTPPVAAKLSSSKLAKSLVQSILQGDWQRNGKAVGFLPSPGTKCKKNGKKGYKCRSQTMSRKSNDTIITYVTVATLSGFTKKNRFNVTYQYNILRLQKEGALEIKQEDEDEEDGDYSADPTQHHFTLKLGAQHTKHKLNCILREERTLECIKNRTQKIEFNDRSGS